MLLVADIGNTRLHLGLFYGERLAAHASFTGDEVLDLDAVWADLTRGLSAPADVEACVVCSVSPKIKIPFMHWAARRFGFRPEVVGESIAYPIPVLLDDPREVGADRVVNAFAAWRLLGQGPIVVCDFGTAITLDVVSAEGAYTGGVIAPGVQTAARALSNQTALLPYVRVRPVDHAIGRNTIDAILGGLYFGMVGMVEAMCQKVRDELSCEAHFVATGGDAAMLAERCSLLQDVRPHLTLTGLRLIMEVERREG